MAASAVSTASRRLFRTLLRSRENSEANIGLEDSLEPLAALQYSDDPAQEACEPQQYISSPTGEACLLKVQSTTLGGELQPAENWIRVPASSHADPILRLAAWVAAEGYLHKNPAFRVLACLGSIFKATLLSPFYGWMTWRGLDNDVIFLHLRRGHRKPIPEKYPEFTGRCREYPKHGRSTLDAPPSDSRTGMADGQESTRYIVKEQRRLHRPRKLYVKADDSWLEVDGDGLQTEIPYIFISYAANQFKRIEDASGQLVLTEESSQRLKQRAEAVTEQNGLAAYWIDFLRAPKQPEASDDVHRFCDVVRGSEQVCVLLAEDRELGHSLATFGKRLWCLPECLLAPKHVIYVQGGGKAETISIMQLPARAWTSSYINESGELVRGKGKQEEFRLLAEHFSGLLTLSRLEMFSVALSAMRALEFFPFQKGDIAYALMGLLRKRPVMDDTDSEQQALARLCLSNDSDRILERISCILPSMDNDFSGWFCTNDSFGANLWDIEPLCQVAGICDDEAIIVDGCHAISIYWESMPRVWFSTRKTMTRKVVLYTLMTAQLWALCAIGFFVILFSCWILLNFYSNRRSGLPASSTISILQTYNLIFQITRNIYLTLSFIAPFCMRYVYSGQMLQVQPYLIGIEGTMPMEQLERLAFGTATKPGRLEYTASSGTLCSRDPQSRNGVAPTIDSGRVPAGHRIFTLLDTVSPSEAISRARTDYVQGNLKVTVFSAPRPPTVALLCGKEGGMLRAVLCSYNASTQALRRETVLRMETPMWNRSSSVGWVKLAL